MTDLLSRQPLRRPAPDAAGRPLALTGVVAALWPAAVLLALCWVVALAGWFGSDGGSHGTPRSALRIGADAWLMAHGSHLLTEIAVVEVVPLGLTVLAGLALFRSGRWAGVTGACDDLRSAGLGAVVLAGTYAVVAVVVAVLASAPGAEPSVLRSFAGAFLLAALCGGAGLLTGAALADSPLRRLPREARLAGVGAVAIVLAMLLLGAVLVASALAVRGDAAANVLTGLRADVAGGLVSTLLVAVAAPNLALLGAAFLLGPGFAVGTGTVVSPAEILLGPVPSVPVLAALPASGSGPSWGWAVPLVPALAAAVVVLVLARVHPTRSYETGAARGLGAGVLAALLVALAVTLSGGAIGPGRMEDVGASFWPVLGAGVVVFGLGGLAGGAGAVLWRRRTAAPEDEPADATNSDATDSGDEPTVTLDTSTEPTVVIPRPRD